MPRVLQLITLSELGGAQKVCAQLSEGLLSSGFEVSLACYPGGWLQEYLAPKGVEIVPLHNMRREIHPIKDGQTLWELYKILRHGNYQIVHCHSSKAGILGRWAAWFARVPTVFTAHGWAFSEGTPAGRRAIALWMERLAALAPGRVVCVSEYDYRLALKYALVDEKKLCVVHNGIEDFPILFRAQPEAACTVHIIMVARFAMQKDFNTLIRAATHLKGDFVVDLVGDGPLWHESRALAASLNTGDKVVFWGARDNIPEMLAHSQIAVLASNWEGLPITLLEAMRAGLPVVATNVGGIPELVQDGVNGYLIPRGDDVLLAERLQVLLDSPAMRQNMGNQSRAHYEGCFTAQRMLAQMLQVYNEMLPAM
ncbi:MAG: glycosyltransferase family 4 protein [Anaerolineae bacterium]|nr:glycosyltransferase family 4 protein [Anaerolineae bacterium]